MDKDLFDNYADLVARFKSGDESAYEELYEKTQRLVYSICIGILGNAEDAFDAMQDTYLTVYRKLDSLEDNKAFISWLKRIANTKSLDLCKKKKDNISYDDAVAADESLQLDDDLETLPDSYIMEKTKREALDKIIRDSLSEVQYQTIHMYYYSELSIDDIAKLMDCPAGTVKTRLKASRVKIKEGVRKYEKDNKDAFAIAPVIPFLTRFFNANSDELKVPDINISSLIGDQASNVAPAIVDAVTQIATNDAAKDVVKGGFLTTTAAKIIAGALAVAVPTAAALGIKSYLDRNSIPVVESTLASEETVSSFETEEIVIEQTVAEVSVTQTSETIEETEETIPETENSETETETVPAVIVPIDGTVFPDAVFRDYVMTNCDSDNDGGLSEQEINSVTSIDVSYLSVTDMTGIEVFSSLTELYCYEAQIQHLNLTGNTALEKFYITGGQLTSIDLSNNANLRVLGCHSTPITSLDFSGNPLLEEVSVTYSAQLSSVIFGSNPSLRTVCFADTALTSIDLSNRSSLVTVYCSNNSNLTSINVSNCSALTDLSVSNCQLSSIDVTSCPSLQGIDFRENSITSIDVSNNPLLASFESGGNQIASIDISNNPELIYLYTNCSSHVNSFRTGGQANIYGLDDSEHGLFEIWTGATVIIN